MGNFLKDDVASTISGSHQKLQVKVCLYYLRDLMKLRFAATINCLSKNHDLNSDLITEVSQ